ncbi:hypothetical protein VPH35_004213 [Triticum aestivum]|uniref:CCHC-type domain-containing protein n=1 Tax=Triticum urartu TaxID=4572 RepID=A0A8R7K3N4_TRIUA
MKMHRACKICGEIGHTDKEHQDGCPYCEASHLGEECPTTRVTCFMCEGTNHNPAQCRLLTTTQEVVQQQRKGMKKAVQEIIMKRRALVTCHKCRSKGHYASVCPEVITERERWARYSSPCPEKKRGRGRWEAWSKQAP